MITSHKRLVCTPRYSLSIALLPPPYPIVQISFATTRANTRRVQCVRVRCLHCGFVRAKNSTRQIEHLQTCQPFLSSTEGQAAVQTGQLDLTSGAATTPMWRGSVPNPNLQIAAQPSVPQPRAANGRFGPSKDMPPPAQRRAPSLVSHLQNKWPDKFSKATQQQFLSHAGCGTLSASALSHWLGQNGHISRAMISFIGTLIGKVRLPETAQSKSNTQYRALDLLISTVSNLRKEVDFIENTKRKYALHGDGEPPSPITKAYMDLLASAADPKSTLLEGMVALWATEHVSRMHCGLDGPLLCPWAIPSFVAAFWLLPRELIFA